MKRIICLFVVMSASLSSFAHDTWVETNTNLIRTGDAVFVDLKLGNHGNEHRDFKLASKIDLEGCDLQIVGEYGASYDLKDRLIDTGYAPKEGYWTTKFAATKPGLYVVAHSLDAVVNHGRPTRSIKSGKTCFVVSDSLDRVPFLNPGFDRPSGHALELIPVANPVTPMGPGEPIRVRVLLKGEPLADARISFIPQSDTLREEFDERTSGRRMLPAKRSSHQRRATASWSRSTTRPTKRVTATSKRLTQRRSRCSFRRCARAVSRRRHWSRQWPAARARSSRRRGGCRRR